MKQNKSQFKRLILSQVDFMQNLTEILFYNNVLTRIKHKINSLFFTLINAQVIYQNKKGDAYRNENSDILSRSVCVFEHCNLMKGDERTLVLNFRLELYYEWDCKGSQHVIGVF